MPLSVSARRSSSSPVPRSVIAPGQILGGDRRAVLDISSTGRSAARAMTRPPAAASPTPSGISDHQRVQIPLQRAPVGAERDADLDDLGRPARRARRASSGGAPAARATALSRRRAGQGRRCGEPPGRAERLVVARRASASAGALGVEELEELVVDSGSSSSRSVHDVGLVGGGEARVAHHLRHRQQRGVEVLGQARGRATSTRSRCDDQNGQQVARVPQREPRAHGAAAAASLGSPRRT